MANTIFQPTFLQPELTSRDMALDQIFSCIVDGARVDSYRIIIYRNSNNAILHDTTQVSLGTVLFNGDTLNATIAAGTVANGIEAKWTIEYFNGTESVISYETIFTTSTTATLTINAPANVTAQEFEFVGTYTQAEDVALQQWYFVLFDNNDVEISRSPISFSGDIRHTFSGFTSGNTFKVQGTLTTQTNKTIQSPLYEFTVAYEVPELDIIPISTVRNQLTAVETAWGGISQVVGSIAGGTGTYIENFLYDGNFGLQLPSNATLSYDVDIPETKTVHHVWSPSLSSFEGRILRLRNTNNSDFYEVGYEDGRFYAEVNNIRRHGLPRGLSGVAFVLTIRGTDLIINEFPLAGTWGFLQANYTWGDLIQFTWDELSTLET